MPFRPFPAPRLRRKRDGRAPRAALPPVAAGVRAADARPAGVRAADARPARVRAADARPARVRAADAALPLGTVRPAGVRTTISRVRATPTAVDTLARDKLDGGAACPRAGVVRGLRTGSVAALQRRVHGDARRR